MIELLAPAGDMEKLKTAFHFGADAVYLAGKSLGLRAFAGNFEQDELKQAVEFAHKNGKKAYVTINIFAKNSDFGQLKDYLQYLLQIKADAVIVSDAGVISFIKKHAPDLKIHLSTQANTTNKYAAQFWGEYVERVILARELSVNEIAEIHEFLPSLQLEAFVHGAMCISYSGRCLLSDFMTHRAANRGECVQSCRWEYSLIEKEQGRELVLQEDARGSYILNSKDLCMIQHLDKLKNAGITSFKIEGRAKSPYYVGGVVNAYRRALNLLDAGGEYNCPEELAEELGKISHRMYGTGFFLGAPEQCYPTSKPRQTYEFTAIVKEKTEGGIIAEQRNRFKTGDVLEVLSAGDANGKLLKIERMYAEGQELTDALNVQQQVFIPTSLGILAGDILRKKI